MDWIHKRVQVFLHSLNMTAIEEVELGGSGRFWGTPKEGIEMGMAHFDSGVGGAASTERVGTSEIGQERVWSKYKRWGRRTQRSLQPRNRPAAADYGETGGHESGGTLGEPLHPLGSGW